MRTNECVSADNGRCETKAEVQSLDCESQDEGKRTGTLEMAKSAMNSESWNAVAVQYYASRHDSSATA